MRDTFYKKYKIFDDTKEGNGNYMMLEPKFLKLMRWAAKTEEFKDTETVA
jgi:hypothetical protein